MEEMQKLLMKKEDWLIERILKYAIERDYTKYTSSLKEAWKISISGITKSICNALEIENAAPEFSPDDKFESDPITEFGIFEAKKHRERGISLPMFLGLLKYYRQTYVDLLEIEISDLNKYKNYRYIIDRCFDKIEISFCAEWANLGDVVKINELQETSRQITNEKNSYLSVFESISDPVILADKNFRIENLNFAATRLLSPEKAPGSDYYQLRSNMRKREASFIGRDLFEIFPCLFKIKNLQISAENENKFECALKLPAQTKYFEVKVSRILDVSEKFVPNIIILRDISTQKKIYNQLKENQKRLDFTVASTETGIWFWDIRANRMEWNEAMNSIFGVTEFGVKTYEQFSSSIHSEDFGRVNREIEFAIINHTEFDSDFRVIRPDNSVRHILSKAKVNYDPDNTAVKMDGICLDITERKQAEDALSESEEKFSKIFNSSPSPILVHRLTDGICIDANESARKILGYSKNELIGSTPAELGFIENHEEENFYNLLNSYGKTLPKEAHIEKNSGEKITLLTNAISVEISGHSYFFTISTDITQEKRVKEELTNSRRMLRDVLNTIPVRVFWKDKDLKFLGCNDQFAKDSGYQSPEDIIGKFDYDLSWKENAESFRLDDLEVMQSGKSRLFYEEPQKQADGTTHWLLTSKIPMTDNSGEVTGILGCYEDISEKKLAEQLLADLYELNEKIVSNSPVGIIVYEETGNCIMANNMAADIVGGALDDLKAQNFNKIKEWQEFDLLDTALRSLRTDREETVEVNMMTTFGKQVWLKCQFSTFFRNEKKHLLLMIEDIFQRKQNERELQEYANTQEVLLREVNHRVKNNLAALISLLHKQQDNINEEENSKTYKILHDLKVRIEGLSTVHSLLSSSGWRPIKCSDLCREVVANVIRSSGSYNNTGLKISESEIKIGSAQAHHLTLVLNELTTNSIKHSVTESPEIQITISHAGNNLRMEYKDSGPGFPEPILRNEYNGCSIGFNLIKGIVEQSLQGEFNIFNENGAVTIIRFALEEY